MTIYYTLNLVQPPETEFIFTSLKLNILNSAHVGFSLLTPAKAGVKYTATKMVFTVLKNTYPDLLSISISKMKK